jgi:hypothetical protein
LAYRILITGSRDWEDEDLIREALLDAWHRSPTLDIVVVHGRARGADTIAGRLAREFGFEVEEHPADWSMGRDAGPARNKHMVSLGADLCLAFILNKSPGATGCAKEARKAGIEVILYEVTKER